MKTSNFDIGCFYMLFDLYLWIFFFFFVVKVKSLNPVLLFVTPWTVAYQAPQSVEFSRQEYWSGLPFPGRFIQGRNTPCTDCGPSQKAGEARAASEIFYKHLIWGYFRSYKGNTGKLFCPFTQFHFTLIL